MASFENSVVVAKNLNFDMAAAKPHLGVLNTAGKIPIGTGNSFPTPEILGGILTSPDNSITFGYSSPNITAVVAGGSTVGRTITGNSGGPLNPTLGNWNIFGSSVAAGTSPVTTSGAVSTLTVNVQRSQALVAADATKVGLANFDSSSFSVDANGFVTLLGGSEAIDSIGVDATSGGGTNPVLPTAAGLVTVNGAIVAAGTNPIRSVSTAANVFQIQVQTSQALAATDATKVGLSNFDSSKFTVDANGFVSTSGTGIGNTITGDSGGALSPTAGNWNLSGSGSITTSGSGSTLTTQLTGLTNHAVLVGAGTTTITKVGPTATAGQVLQSAGAAADPAFSTATYPSTTTVSQILYSSATNVVSGLATANSAALVTNSTGVPVWSSTMTDGQLIIGNTSATPTAATPTSTGGSFITGSGSLKYQPANYNLGISNLGVSYNAGTGVFTILDHTGSALSSTNPAYVTIQSKTTPGISKTIAVTANQDFIDDTGASEIIGNLFGLTTGVAYTDDMPFYIYGILNDAEDTIKFAICRIPSRSSAPATANLGCPGTANADTQGSMFIFDTVTLGDYDTNPCICLGSIRMRMSASDDWTVQALVSADGIGNFNESTVFNVTLGTFGAATGTFIKANGGTAPIFSTNLYTYTIDRFGRVQQSFFMTGDGGTDGAGAVTTYMETPLIPAESQQVPNSANLLIYSAGVTTTEGYTFYDSGSITGWRLNTAAVVNVTNALFTNGARTVAGKLFFLLSNA